MKTVITSNIYTALYFISFISTLKSDYARQYVIATFKPLDKDSYLKVTPIIRPNEVLNATVYRITDQQLSNLIPPNYQGYVCNGPDTCNVPVKPLTDVVGGIKSFVETQFNASFCSRSAFPSCSIGSFQLYPLDTWIRSYYISGFGRYTSCSIVGSKDVTALFIQYVSHDNSNHVITQQTTLNRYGIQFYNNSHQFLPDTCISASYPVGLFCGSMHGQTITATQIKPAFSYADSFCSSRNNHHTTLSSSSLDYGKTTTDVRPTPSMLATDSVLLTSMDGTESQTKVLTSFTSTMALTDQSTGKLMSILSVKTTVGQDSISSTRLTSTYPSSDQPIMSTTTVEMTTPEKVESTYTSIGTSNPNKRCLCRCKPSTNTTFYQLEDKLSEIRRNLTIPKNETSKYRRRKLSIYETRVVAKGLGYLGAVVLFTSFGIIISGDLSLFCRYLHLLRRKTNSFNKIKHN